MGKFEWNLNEFFIDQTACDAYCVELRSSCDEFRIKYENNLNLLSQDEFEKVIKIYENLSQKIAFVESWAYLNFAKNTNNGQILAKYEKICSKLEEKLIFFGLEFNQISNDKQNKFIAQTPKYSYFLEQIQKQKPHQLSFKEERILLFCSNTGVNAFARLFDESISRIKFDFRGEKLSEEEILSKLSDFDRSVRKDAALGLSKGLKANSHLLAYIYNIIRADLKNDCELRNYSSAEDFRHLDNQINKDSVDALINAATGSFDLVSRFYNKKKEILGFDELYDYDRYAPLGDDSEYSFDEAQKIMLEAFSEFSLDFANIAKNGLENGWCDAMPSPNKIGGAFSHSAVSQIHPFVLLNFTNKRRDVYTLAHEFGHAIHQFLAYKAGFLGSQTPLVTAETASVFCEMLVFERIKNKASNDEKKAILANKLEDIFATLYRQINFTTFERRIHEIESELSINQINKIWLEESKKMFGDSLKLNDYYEFWWSYIPHFIHSPFYCYAYSFAQLLVLAIFGLYKSGKCENFVEIYTKFLSLGGSKSPKELVEMFGFDISKDEFWQIGISEIKKLVDEFERL